MPMIPQSLVAQAFAILKERIARGEWIQWLPSERVMCDSLVISRGTLRKALTRLEQEGLIKSRQGRRWEIVKRKKRVARTASKHVALLASFSLSIVAPFEAYMIDSLRAHLQDAGYYLDVFQNLDYRSWRYAKVLEELVREVRPEAWVLPSAPAHVQRWFSEHKLSCVIVGSRHSGVALPSLDRDLPAVCRHAVGRLAGKGKDHIALLIAGRGLAGDLACEESYLETAAQILKPRGGTAVIARHNGTREDIFRRLAAIMDRKPRPTGILVTDTRYTLSALSFFQQRGLRLPGDVSLISRDSDHFLEYVSPTVARYLTDPSSFALRVAKMALRLAEGDNVPPRDYRVVPKFAPGETLG